MNIKKIIKEELKDFEWIKDITPYGNEFFKQESIDNLSELDNIQFIIPTNNDDKVYGFCYDCATGRNNTLIYNTKYKPNEYYESDYGSRVKNGNDDWKWVEIRKNFLKGTWLVS